MTNAHRRFVLGAMAAWSMLWAAPAVLAQVNETPFATAEATVNLDLPDAGAPVRHAIRVPGSGAVDEVRAAVRVRHEAPEQLFVSLTGPTGITVILHDQTPSEERPFHPVYPVTAAPLESLERFAGGNAQGEWVLEIRDLVPGITGTLEAWGLRLRPAGLMEPPPPTPVPLPADDGYALAFELAVEPSVNAVFVYDLNGDGLDDPVLLTDAGARIHYANGNAFEREPVELSAGEAVNAAAGLLDGGAIVDLAVASRGAAAGESVVSVYLGQGDGGFAPRFEAAAPSAADRFTLAFLEDGGAPGLLLGGVPHWLSGTGDGAFAPARPPVLLARELLAASDINFDGITDLFANVARGGTSPNADPFILIPQRNASLPLNRETGYPVEWNGRLLGAFAANLREPAQPGFAALTQSDEADAVQWLVQYRPAPGGGIRRFESRLAAGALAPPVVPFDLNGDGLDELITIKPDGVYAFQLNPDGLGGASAALVREASAAVAQPGLFFSGGEAGLAVVGTDNIFRVYRSNAGPRPEPPAYRTPVPSPTPFLFVTPTPPPPSPTAAPTPTPELRGNPDLNFDGVVDRRDLLILIEAWGRTGNGEDAPNP